MSPLSWIEASLLVTLLGAMWVSLARNAASARRRALLCGSLACASAAASWWGSAFPGGPGDGAAFRALASLERAGVLGIDGISAPLPTLVALLFLVTMAVTLRTKIRRFSFSRTLLLEALLLLMLCAKAPWMVILLLGASAVPVALELRARGRSVRVLAVHLGASLLLLVVGSAVALRGPPAGGWSVAGYAMIAGGVAIRAGLFPVHCWVVDLFENAALGTSLVAMLPLAGAYAAVRLLVPGAPDGVLLVLAYLAAFSSLYCAMMSTVQANARPFVCQMCLSQSSLVLAGIVLATPLAVTAGLLLWLSVPLSVLGLGLTIRSLEARTGRLSLRDHQGLHVQTPTLAALFLVTGLAAVGFPGTLGFFGTEMLTDACTRNSRVIGVAVVLSAALSGIAVVRAYGKLFLGGRHQSSVNIRIRKPELAALLVLVGLLAGGTLWPQPGILSRSAGADALLELRERQAHGPSSDGSAGDRR